MKYYHILLNKVLEYPGGMRRRLLIGKLERYARRADTALADAIRAVFGDDNGLDEAHQFDYRTL